MLGAMMDTGDQNWRGHDALAALAWQVELGADEALLDEPLDRFELPDAAPKMPAAAKAQSRQRGAPPAAVAPPPKADPAKAAAAAAELAQTLAAGVQSLDGLRETIAGFELCDLKRGARNLVFADGDPSARVMVIGEAPGQEEDRIGKPFVGSSGQLLDAMFAAIGLARDGQGGNGLYITNLLPWRPPQNRDPSPEELEMLLPFVKRHVELAAPDVVVLMGNWACQGLLGQRGITRLRGQWAEVLSRPALPMFHPAYLLRQPAEKAKAWADLLSLQAHLRGDSTR